MKWEKRGRIFNPTNHGLPFDCFEFAQSPQALAFKDFVRIYFSTRKRDAQGQYISVIRFLDFDKDFNEIINFSKEEVISPGDIGTFDEHGIFPFSPLKTGKEIWAYTCGWSRRISVPVETSTGLAISHDEGLTFQKYGIGPILTSSLTQPFLVGDSFVIMEGDKFHMWYMYGKRWFVDPISKITERVYKIGYAFSYDGINWNKQTGIDLIQDVLGEDECQALPSIIKVGDIYHMYFCYRYSTDFRNNSDRSYRLGYAYSYDLISWIRDDQRGGMELSDRDWDSEMMCYPNIFKSNGKIFLLYNGNEFGKFGFGLAELISL